MNRTVGYLHGLDAVRVLAAVAVVYTHVANWFETRRLIWSAGQVVDDVLITPLQLNHNLSFVGVCAFLLVSGVVVTHVALRETPAQFTWRRAVRLLPALVVVTTAVWLLVHIGWVRPAGGEPDQSLLDLLGNATLLVYFVDPGAVLLGVTWTLLVQFAFYAYVALTLPLLHRWPWLPPLLGATLASVLVSLSTSFIWTVPVFRLGLIGAYFPVLLLGQTIYLVRAGLLPRAAGIALGAANLGLFIHADSLRYFTATGTAHSRTLLLLALVVILAMSATGRVVRSPYVAAPAKRTYAVFLVHEACVYPVMDALQPAWGTWPALLSTLLVVIAATELVYRFVENLLANRLRPLYRPQRPKHVRMP